MRTGDGGDGLGIDAAHPGNGDAIVEADHQFGFHRRHGRKRLRRCAPWNGRRLAIGMKSITLTEPVAVVKFGFQDQAVAAIAPWSMRGVARFLIALTCGPARSASGHVRARPEARRNRRRNRNAACTASRSNRRGPPGPRCGNRRSPHNPRSAGQIARRRPVDQPDHFALRLQPARRKAGIAGAGARHRLSLGRARRPGTSVSRLDSSAG